MKTKYRKTTVVKPHFVSTQIGYFDLSDKTKVTHEFTHEVAAWSTSAEALPGRHRVFIGWSHYSYGRELSIYVEFAGKVTSNYTPSLFGGVRCGSRDGSERVGEACKFSKSYPVLRTLWSWCQGQRGNHDKWHFDLNDSLMRFIQMVIAQKKNAVTFSVERLDDNRAKGNWSMVGHYADDLGRLETDLSIAPKILRSLRKRIQAEEIVLYKGHICQLSRKGQTILFRNIASLSIKFDDLGSAILPSGQVIPHIRPYNLDETRAAYVDEMTGTYFVQRDAGDYYVEWEDACFSDVDPVKVADWLITQINNQALA